MTESLREVVAQIAPLPLEQQDVIAGAMRQELEEREWAAQLAKPGSQRALMRLVAGARREDAAGETRESGERW